MISIMTIDSSTPPPPHKKEVEPNIYSSPSSTPQQQQQAGAAAVMAGDEDESSPLMMKRHISMTDEEDGVEKVIEEMEIGRLSRSKIPYVILAMVALVFYASQAKSRGSPRLVVTPIEEAVEHTIDVGNNTTIWFRTWGKHPKNYLSADMYVPALLFVHGGPGQAVADYNDGNKRFFDKESMFVVEVDQRGTGNSQPSVRDDYRNMKHYMDISIDLIAKDFELIRSHLGIEEWVVWGGSYGSTIALNYCMLYPKSCTALLLRGIYLDTKEELSEVYSRHAFEDDKRKLNLFDNLYELAQMEVKRVGGDNATELDPNDYERLLQVYESMIARGDRAAIWRWTAFENNLMEDRPKMQLDPNNIIEEKFAEAQSVAFFETRLWLHETFEDPSNLLAAERLARLRNIPIWICQGVYDNVCPVQNAWSLVRALQRANHRHSRSDDPGLLQAYFLDANHEDTDPVMESCLKKIMYEFLSRYTR
jgi:proline iminopeptidase